MIANSSVANYQGRSLPLRRFAYAAFAITVLFLLAAPYASAEGGQSIATAPTAIFGTQEFGSIKSHDEGGCKSWWLLPAIAGDKLQIDWEVQSDPYVVLQLYLPGTNDFNWEQTSSAASGSVNGNDKAEFTYEAQRTGAMPLLFDDPGCHGSGVPGPYSFTAYVTHALNVFLPRVSTLHKTGVIAIGVHNPEGGAVSGPGIEVELQMSVNGSWRTIGDAAVNGTIASVHYKVASHLRGRRVTVRAVAHGSGYSTTASSHLRLQVR